jgi:hypothetical protein
VPEATDAATVTDREFAIAVSDESRILQEPETAGGFSKERRPCHYQ